MSEKNEPTTPDSPKQPGISPADLRKRFHDDEENYLRLNGDTQAVRLKKQVWDTDYTIEKYVASTDHVIGLLDGSIEDREIADPINPERSQEKPDVVIWLDKSARPVSWFVDAFWEQFAEDGAIKPQDEFLNIDRENWFVKQGHSRIDAKRRLGPTDFAIDKVPMEELAGLRAIFTIGDLSEDNWQEEVWNLPTRLDNKNILIIDEVKNKGGTLAIATQLIRAAFPGTTVSGDYFWEAGAFSLGRTSAEKEDQQMETAPVWYDTDSSFGRGIGEVSLSYWKHLYESEPTQANLKNILGSFALSAPHHDPETYELTEDVLAKKLEQDIAYLTYAVADKKVLRTPHKERPLEQIKDILKNQGLTIDQFRNYREMRSKNPRTKVDKP